VGRLDNSLGLLSNNGNIFGSIFGPGPSVPEEHLRQDVQVGRIGTSIVCCDTDRHGVRVLFVFGVLHGSAYSKAHRDKRTYLDKNIPVSVLVKDIGVDQFEFRDISTSVLVLLLDLLVRESTLRVLVQELHVRVCWGRIEVPVHLLDVLSVISS
jgi:hypothetical protein